MLLLRYFRSRRRSVTVRVNFEEGSTVRRSLIAVLIGALTSMGLAITAGEAGTAPADAVASEPAPAPGNVSCYSIPTPAGTSLDLCDHGPDMPADLPLGRPLDTYAQYDPPL